MYIVTKKNETFFLADTTVNVDPTPEELADIALQAADFATNFDIVPRVALLSYSNFGSVKGKVPDKMRSALKIIRERAPELMVDGEMQANTAVSPEILESAFPFSSLKGGANVLVFPGLASGNISYKLLNKIGGLKIIGPALNGFCRSVHILQRGDDVHDILNMTALAVVDAQAQRKKNVSTTNIIFSTQKCPGLN